MTKLEEKIAQEVRNAGVIPLSRFMELALYCPVYGYYEKEGDKLGRHGDYFTSVSVGRLFGELLAFQFCEWLEAAIPAAECRRISTGCHAAGQAPGDPDRRFQLVEAGAHRGDLAADILAWIHAERPQLAGRIEYWVVEPSERRQSWQRATLAKFGEQVRWARSLAELPGCQGAGAVGISGVIFCNELLDAMPVHRFGWDARRKDWFEWGVSWGEGRFVWEPIAPASNERWKQADSGWFELAKLLDSAGGEPGGNVSGVWAAALGEWIHDGFTIEVCPAARTWWREAAAVLGVGRLMTIDYGFEAWDFLRPERKDGTLRAYHRHRLCPDVLGQPGEQDLTAHVNFSALMEAGLETGLRTEAFTSQSQFLTGIAGRIWAGKESNGPWSAELGRQFHTLTHPEHLGRAFRVLVQIR